MPTRTVNQWPEPLPKAEVVRGTIKRTWPRALYAAALLTGFYFLGEFLFRVPQPTFAYGYSLGASLGWMTIVMSRTIWLWWLAKHHYVPFRILWEVVVKYDMTPAAAMVREKAFMVRNIESMRGHPLLDAQELEG